VRPQICSERVWSGRRVAASFIDIWSPAKVDAIISARCKVPAAMPRPHIVIETLHTSRISAG
jgi:hypothetical protein